MAEVTLPTLTEYRQSALRSLEVCPRRLRKAFEVGDLITGWTGESTTLGSIFHEFVFEYMEELKRQIPLAKDGTPPPKRMSSEEAIVVAREVYTRRPDALNSEHYEALMGMAARFATEPWAEWDVRRILFQEVPLRVDILCADGEVRTLKGAPDLVYSDPPYGATVWDWKTGRATPKSPQKVEPDGEPLEGVKYLSDVGKFQRRIYGYLVLMTLPTVQYVNLWEVPLRFAKHGPRHARLTRSQLEHVEPWIGANMIKLDRGLREGPQSDVWEPKPGSQCLHCEAARGCPVPPSLRGVGAVESQLAADIEARRYARGKAMYEQAAERLKARQEAGFPPGRPNAREEARWGPEADAWQRKGGGRGFKLWPAIETTSESEAA